MTKSSTGGSMLFRALLDLLFPPLCHACKTFIPQAGDLLICAACLEKITFLVSPLCTTCGTPMTTEHGRDHLCGTCLTAPPDYTCRSATLFAGPVQELIHRFKYGYRVHLCQPLGILVSQSLADFSNEMKPEVILPVPLHRKRLRQRGYNQSQLIGEVLAKRWGIRQHVGNLRRLRWTESQTGLDADERRENVKGAFAVREPHRLAGKRVLLVDDVFTTGSTIRACAEALQDAGVTSVSAVTVARSLPGYK